MKTPLFLGILLMGVAVMGQAQIVQTLTLKNGSVLNGYMKSQQPGSSCVFFSEKAVVVMDGTAVQAITPKKVSYTALSDAWRQWAEDNEVLYGLGDSREMTLSTITDKQGRNISEVYVLEKGQAVKYVEFTAHDYPLNWDEIASIEYVKRPNTLLSGLNRSFTVKTGGTPRTVAGQCLKETPDAIVYLLEDDGVVESFAMTDIVKDNSIKNNPNQSLFGQSALLDEIVLKNGTVHQGIVTERNYEAEPYYFLLTSQNGGVEYTTSLKMSDVAEFRKKPNPDYQPVYDILLKEGDMVVNREETTLVQLTEQDNRFELSNDTTWLNLKAGQLPFALTVESNFKDNKSSQDWLLIKARKVEKTKKKAGHYEFDYADMIKSSLAPTETVTSMNNTTKMAYQVAEAGVYVFFNKNTRMAITMEIK